MTGAGGSAEGLDGLLDQTSRLLESVRSARATRDADQTERTGTGEAADGRVQATVGRDYRLSALRIDPRAMRLDSEALAAQVMQAVNAAVDALQVAGAPAEAELAPGVDTAELSSRLDELRQESVRNMAAFTQAMDEVVARLTRGAGR